MAVWNQISDRVAQIPSAVWATAVVLNVVATAATMSVARRRVRRAGQRAANPETDVTTVKDTALTVASLVPAGLFWCMVLAGSFHGLVAFGRDTLGWRDGWQYLVPGTLDGVSVTFALLAFRAVRREKTPDRCYRVVWGAAAASATINFFHEYAASANVLAGGYVALLSLFGMFMFDEFLNQFERGAQTVRRENPKFGIRWLTWPTNTFCAAIAWRNHPPAEGTSGTVLNAVANLQRVRDLKRQRRRPVQPAAQPEPTAETRPPVTTTRTRGLRRARRAEHGGEAKVPATAATLAQWASVWVRLRADTAFVTGPLSDDDRARTVYGLSARQLRHIRHAATSGALRRQAVGLGVGLPDDYVEQLPAVVTD